MNRKYKLTECPKCPNCDKQLESNDITAKDFVVCDFTRKPIGDASKDRCGWCNKLYVAIPNTDLTEISFLKVE